jgi:uncharacterized SAM-binding protein YcdF (DUF218 family)
MIHSMRSMAFIVFLIAALVIAWFIFRESILTGIGNYLILGDHLEPADLIHVIAGTDDRTDYAISLYQQGLAEEIFFTGGWCEKHQVVHSLHVKERAISQGVPAAAIVTDETVIDTTYAEATRLKEYISHGAKKINTVIIVSDPFHMRRAQWTYRKVLGDLVKIQMAPVPFELARLQRRWWTDPSSTKMVKDEYVKMIFYLVRYQIGEGAIKKWFATFDKY